MVGELVERGSAPSGIKLVFSPGAAGDAGRAVCEGGFSAIVDGLAELLVVAEGTAPSTRARMDEYRATKALIKAAVTAPAKPIHAPVLLFLDMSVRLKLKCKAIPGKPAGSEQATRTLGSGGFHHQLMEPR